MAARIRLAMFVFAASACLASVPALGDSDAGGMPVHHGFYFNTDVGPAATHVTFNGPHDHLGVRSGAANVDFRFGYALTPHFVLSLDLNGMATANKPDTTLNGSSIRYGGDSYYGASMLGVGLSWYSESNICVGFTLGPGRVTQHLGNTDIKSESGFAAQVRVGREWWVGNDWGLGLVGGLGYVSASANVRESVVDPSGATYTAYFDHAEARTAFIAFSATFN